MTIDNTVTYISIENHNSTLPVNLHGEVFKVSQLSQLKAFVRKNKKINFIIVIDSIDKSLVLNLANIAFNFSKIIKINGIEYDFTKIGRSDLKEHEELKVLVDQAKEVVFFEAALYSLVHNLSYKAPLIFSEETATKILGESFVTNHKISGLNNSNDMYAKEVASAYIKQAFDKRREKVKLFISPEVNENIIEVKLDFEKDLINFIGNNPGVIVFNGGVGSGKTKHGILPCFEYFCSQNQRPLLITPLIALTQKLINDDRNYKIAQKKNNLTQQPGIATCLDTVTTKREFIKYSKNSNVTIIDEFGECLNIFTQNKRVGGTLTARVTAIEEFFGLLNKPQVIIADALFSDLSARQLVKMTGKKVFLLSNTNSVHHKSKVINIVEENQHLSNLINERKSGKSIALFNDSSQKNKKASLAIFNAVTGGDESIGENVNANFLKKKRGEEYLSNIDEELVETQIHQFSPSITSGHSFERVVMDSVNVISNKTTLPTQVIQSSSRFRLNEQISLSFIKPFMPSDYETNIDKIIKSIVSEEVMKNADCDRSELISNDYVYLIAELIQQNHEMRNDYCSNTILMFEMLGFEINNLASDKLSQELAKKAIKRASKEISEERFDQFTNDPITDNQYYQLFAKKYYCSNEEEQLRDVYEFVSQYRIQGHRLLVEPLLAYDKYGDGHEHLKNMNLLIGDSEPENKEQTIKFMFYREIVKRLKLTPNLLTGKWLPVDLNNLNVFFNKGTFFVDGKTESIKDLFEVIFSYTKVSDAQPITAVKAIFEKEFGLKINKKKQDQSINPNRPYEYWLDEQEVQILLNMPKVLSNDIVNSKLGLLELYKIYYSYHIIKPELIDAFNPNIDEVENKLQRAKKWAEEQYDYPVPLDTLNAIDECSIF